MATSETPATSPEAGLKDRLSALGRRVAPWLSLALGLSTAVMMDRSPGKAGFFALVSVGGWALLVALSFVKRVNDPSLPQAAIWAARFGSLAAARWQAQRSLLFALPFYLVASPGQLRHLAFEAAMLGACAVTVWTPWYTALTDRKVPSLVFQAFASFAALNVVLPVLGASNRVGLWAAAAITALVIPLGAAAMAHEGRAAVALRATFAGLIVPVILAVGGATLIPPAPLRLVKAQMGTAMAGYEAADPSLEFTAPPQLVCATAIAAPRGLSDALFHVWAHDGKRLARVSLAIQGGNEKGFRTWSIWKNVSNGEWTCRVETASGQVLGQRTVEVKGRPR